MHLILSLPVLVLASCPVVCVPVGLSAVYNRMSKLPCLAVLSLHPPFSCRLRMLTHSYSLLHDSVLVPQGRSPVDRSALPHIFWRWEGEAGPSFTSVQPRLILVGLGPAFPRDGKGTWESGFGLQQPHVGVPRSQRDWGERHLFARAPGTGRQSRGLCRLVGSVRTNIVHSGRAPRNRISMLPRKNPLPEFNLPAVTPVRLS